MNRLLYEINVNQVLMLSLMLTIHCVKFASDGLIHIIHIIFTHQDSVDV